MAPGQPRRSCHDTHAGWSTTPIAWRSLRRCPGPWGAGLPQGPCGRSRVACSRDRPSLYVSIEASRSGWAGWWCMPPASCSPICPSLCPSPSSRPRRYVAVSPCRQPRRPRRQRILLLTWLRRPSEVGGPGEPIRRAPHPESERRRPMSVDLSARAVDARLRQASQLAGSLRPERRLDNKLDMSATGVAARLRTVSDLLDLCRVLARKGQPVAPTERA